MAHYNWKVGEIAFLNQREFLNEADAAVTAQLPPQTFGHPMIILRISHNTGYALVTSVTAFGSGPQNDFMPPWKHPFHCRKPTHLLRAFEGTERPPKRGERKQAPLLHLREGRMMPKTKTSWVYTRWSHIIPTSALIYFDKSAYQLQLTKTSLDALVDAMTQASQKFHAEWVDPRVVEVTKIEAAAQSPAAKTTTAKAMTAKAPMPPVKAPPVKTTTPPTTPTTAKATPVKATLAKTTTPPVKTTTPPSKAAKAATAETTTAPVKTVQKCRSWANVAAGN